MNLTGGNVVVCSPRRNFVTLKLETGDGVYGLGEATLNGRELAVASYLTDHVIPLLVGRDARRIEDIWQFLYKGASWRRGPVTMTAIAAVDTALWDLKGKALNAPVYQLLGGASRDSVMVSGHASGETVEETVDAVSGYVARGYKAVRAQTTVPGFARTYGVSRGDDVAGRDAYEPAERGLAPETQWSSERYLECVPPLFELLRNEFGTNLHLLHDVHHRLTPIEAGRLGKAVEPHRLFWLEDPTPAEHQEAFRANSAAHDHASGRGRGLQLDSRLPATDSGAADRLHPDHRRACWGHQPSSEDASLAELYQIRTGAHGATDLSPVCMAAALHFNLSVHNFGIQEYMPHTADTDRVFPHAYSFGDGAMHPGDAPGLGVDIDEALAAAFPYQRAYLPIARLTDGTMHNW